MSILLQMRSTRLNRRVPQLNAPLFASLEPRLVFAAVAATAYEQYMLELINRGRANPAAEAARFGIALNEGVSGTAITTAAKQPLAMNGFLTSAIRDHVGWLRVNSKFQHDGSGGSAPQGRMSAAGYEFAASYGSAENLGLTLGSSLGDLADRVETLYRKLFVDEGVAGRGHRVNLLHASMEEVGVGVASGAYTYNGSNGTAIIAGQDFAYRDGNAFLTGVVYDDNLVPDDFYSPGEGRNAFTVTATSSGGAAYTATTGIAGGYALLVPAGTYTVTATGPGISGVAKYSGVVVGGQNVKRDFEAGQFSAGGTTPAAVASVSKGTLSVNGTAKSESISVLLEGSTIHVQVGATKLTFPASSVLRVSLNAGRGNDYVLVGEAVPPAAILGGDGDDTIGGTAGNDVINAGIGDDLVNAGGGNDNVAAGDGDDTVNGEGGKDRIHGDDGMDRLNGAGGNDVVFGDADNDRVYGGSGNDQVDGGGNVDRVYGDDGDDSVMGGSSNDRLYGGIGADNLWGGRGKDHMDGGAGTNRVRDREDLESVLNAGG